MEKRLLLFWCVLISPVAHGQFTDPRTYTSTPVGINQVELAYAYAHANSSLDTSLIVTGANVNLSQGTISYTRYFDLFHRMIWVQAAVPVASIGGSLSGASIHGSNTSTGDSSYQMGVLIAGAPALSISQLDKYTPGTTFGASFSVTAPTGSYDENKILNLGSDRWSLKPELGVCHPFGSEQKWELDAYANVFFYTDNTSYLGKQILRQEPLPGFEGHLSYAFNHRLWTSIDARYSFRASTYVDGIDQNNPQQNFVLGSETNVSLNARHALVLVIAKALVHNNGPAILGFSLRYDYTWGSGYK